MPFGVVAAELAPEVIGGLEGAGAATGGEFFGGMALDGAGLDAGAGIGGLDGAGYGGAGDYASSIPGESVSNSAMGSAGSSGGGWMNYLKNPQYLGLAMMGLSTLNSRNISKQNAAMQQAALQRQLQRQALMDNPPAYAGMGGPGMTPTNNWGANVESKPSFSYEDLKGYGAGPERHWAARGGLAEHTPMHGGLEQARMVDHPEGGGQEDNVPAMLSPKEYVLDADVVSAIGDGNPDEGARRLDAFRERLRTHKRSAPAHRIPPKAHPIESYMRRVA